jgi:hypothetical protein
MNQRLLEKPIRMENSASFERLISAICKNIILFDQKRALKYTIIAYLTSQITYPKKSDTCSCFRSPISAAQWANDSDTKRKMCFAREFPSQTSWAPIVNCSRRLSMVVSLISNCDLVILLLLLSSFIIRILILLKFLFH